MSEIVIESNDNKKTRSEYMKEYRQKNKDKMKEYAKKWYENNKDNEEYKLIYKERSKEYRLQVKSKLEKLKELEKVKELEKINN